MSNILLIDFGSTYTKVTAVDLVQETVLGTARGVTTVETNIMDGLNSALKELFAATGELKFEKVLACSSAAGGLKMAAIGLVPELTAEAAKRAALGAGAKVLGVYGHELSEYEIAEIAGLKPDIILLAGGTDGGNKAVILHNAAMLKHLGQDVPVVVAGNKSVTPQVVQTLSEFMSEVVPTANVLPKLSELNIEPARETIRGVFLRKIVEAKGLNKAKEFVDRMVMPTPAAVLKAAELFSVGTPREKGAGDLMVVDIGGATTDIYSIASGDPTGNAVMKGIPEPFAKRTVEGDLGMRYSATALLKAGGARLIAEFAGATDEAVEAYVRAVAGNVDHLPQNERETRLEDAMGRACTKLASERHVGQLETFHAACGQVQVQTGKDLSKVGTVVGTGGVIVTNERPDEILKGIVYNEKEPMLLKPRRPEFMVDDTYIMSAMGLLGEDYPDIAVRMMKKYIVRR